jgi:hypothetical protein
VSGRVCTHDRTCQCEPVDYGNVPISRRSRLVIVISSSMPISSLLKSGSNLPKPRPSSNDARSVYTAHARTHTHTHTHTHTFVHTFIHTFIHSYTHAPQSMHIIQTMCTHTRVPQQDRVRTTFIGEVCNRDRNKSGYLAHRNWRPLALLPVARSHVRCRPAGRGKCLSACSPPTYLGRF